MNQIITPQPGTGTSTSAILLDIRGLRIEFGTGQGAVVAARNIDLRIGAGEVVALVGESGSGKSTLSNAIIGLLPPSASVKGEIIFNGLDLVKAGEKAFLGLRGSEIGLVPQDPGASLDPVKTIGSQVREVFRLSREHRKLPRRELDAKVVELLTLVGIDRPGTRLKQYPYELSGGLKQRVLIAMAFGRRPRLLIADEPTSALDVTVQKQVLEVFDRLTKEFGTAVIFVTHDLAVATDHASRVVVMQTGTIKEDKPTADILLRPDHEYTIRLLQEAEPVTHESAETAAADTGPMPVPAIAVNSLSRDFGEHRAVNGVSFTVDPGTTFSLVGESGSGKSTTARMIMKLLDSAEGTIAVDGRDISRLRSSEKRELWRSIQLVYQNPDSALDPRWRVGEIIAEPLRSFGVGSKAERRERVRELLRQVNLPESAIRRRPRELSGGQRQRVAIARALALGARILILDEALSALDVLTQAQILQLLETLQADLGLTYLFISHDLHVVRRISHRVGVMRQGELVELGTAAQVFGDPRSEYTRRLLDANPGHRLEEAARRRGGPAGTAHLTRAEYGEGAA